MRMRVLFASGLLAILTLGPRPARAALPPSCYPNPEHAAEIVDIRVLSSCWLPRPFKSSPFLVTWRVLALARVTRVHATQAGLRPGSVITISYDSEWPTVPLCGGFNCYPLLFVGEKCRIHLFPDSIWPGVYEPCGAPYNSIVAVTDEPFEKAQREETKEWSEGEE